MRLLPRTATWEPNEMNPSRNSSLILVMVLLVGRCNRVDAAKLADVRTVDRQHVMIHLRDGEITYRDDGQRPKAFEGGESIVDRLIRYQPELDSSVAARPESYTIAPRTPGPAEPP